MRIWLLIVLLVSCVAGFVASYGYAYQKVSGALLTPTSQTNTASTLLLNKQ